MALETPLDNTDAQRADIQLTLTGDEARSLRSTVPWLLQALADRPTATARQRERRHRARTALESLLSALSNQSQQAQELREVET